LHYRSTHAPQAGRYTYLTFSAIRRENGKT